MDHTVHKLYSREWRDGMRMQLTLFIWPFSTLVLLHEFLNHFSLLLLKVVLKLWKKIYISWTEVQNVLSKTYCEFIKSKIFSLAHPYGQKRATKRAWLVLCRYHNRPPPPQHVLFTMTVSVLEIVQTKTHYVGMAKVWKSFLWCLRDISNVAQLQIRAFESQHVPLQKLHCKRRGQTFTLT